jgi:hypothetical protein
MTHHDDQGYAKDKVQDKDCKKSGPQTHHIGNVGDIKSRTLCSQNADAGQKLKGLA